MKQQHTASRHKQQGFVAPASAREKLSSRVLDEADKSLEYTLTAVRGNIDGLTATEAANRLIQFGPNEVTHDKPPHALIQLLQAFKNPFVMVLIALGLALFVEVGRRFFVGAEPIGLAMIIVMLMRPRGLWPSPEHGKSLQNTKG